MNGPTAKEVRNDDRGADAAFDYDPRLVDVLREAVAQGGEQTFEGLLTTSKYYATQNDLETARRYLEKAFGTYGSADSGKWTDLVRTAIFCRQKDVAGWLLSQRYAGGPSFVFTLNGEETLSWPIDVFEYQALGRSRGVLCVHRSLYSSWFIDFLIDRLIGTLPLLASYCKHSANDPGRLALNLGDAGTCPGIAFCANNPRFFLIPDIEFMNSKGYVHVRTYYLTHAVPWNDRTPVAFWRGKTTGHPEDPHLGWRSMPRIKLCQIATANAAGLFDVGISSVELLPNDPGIQEIPSSGLMRPYVAATEFQKYKYQIDIDGYTNSWPGLFQKLLTGSPVVKVDSRQGYRQWYYDRLRPWVNFVPALSDMSDLVEKVEWLRRHDDVARRIGESGQALAMSLSYESEVEAAGRTIAAAIRCFSCRPETELRFNAGIPDDVRLVDGWAAPREEGIPTVGVFSRLELPRPIASEAFELALDLSPVAVDPALPAQRVGVVVNGEILCNALISERCTIRCRVSRRTIETARSLSVMLLHPDATRLAAECRPLDDRLHSLVLHGVAVTPESVYATTPGPRIAVLHGSPRRTVSVSTAGIHPSNQWVSSKVRRGSVKTHWETVVFLDVERGALRHGPEESSPDNVAMHEDEGRANLLYVGPGDRRSTINVASNSLGSCGSSAGRPQGFLVVQATVDGQPKFGLQSEGLFLCAEPDGRITLSRKALGPWEQFQLAK